MIYRFLELTQRINQMQKVQKDIAALLLSEEKISAKKMKHEILEILLDDEVKRVASLKTEKMKPLCK